MIYPSISYIIFFPSFIVLTKYRLEIMLLVEYPYYLINWLFFWFVFYFMRLKDLIKFVNLFSSIQVLCGTNTHISEPWHLLHSPFTFSVFWRGGMNVSPWDLETGERSRTKKKLKFNLMRNPEKWLEIA